MDAKQWAEKIVQVQSGLLTATEAAKQLGVSRKSYYKRENRALAGMMAAVEDRVSGRPGKAMDEEKEALKERVVELEKEVLVLQQTARIREVLEGAAEQNLPEGGGEEYGLEKKRAWLDR